MGKQTKSKKSENLGKGKVTPAQIAFIVDQYLSDNTFTQTRSTFRTEASTLISKSPVQAPKSLLSLGAMLEEYICLKEQKVMMDHEKSCLEQEKFRVQTLLRGMQDAMNAYNSGGTTVVPQPVVSSVVAKSVVMAPQIDRTSGTGSPSGFPVYNTPAIMSTTRTSNTPTDPTNFSTPVTLNQTSRRRKGSKDTSNAPVAAKKPRVNSSTNQLQAKGTEALVQPITASNNQETALHFYTVQASPHVNVNNGSPIQGSNVAKCLFNQSSQSPPINSSGPKTPPRATTSQTGKSVSPLENLTLNNNITPQQITSTNCTVITSETIRVSPMKQVSYYSIERNHCISSSSPIKTNIGRQSKRDHVKGRLDFDGSDVAMSSGKPISCGISVSESEKEGEMFDLDLPNLDAFGADFSLSEFLLDFDFDGAGIGYCSQPATDSSPESLSGSPHTCGDVDVGANQVLSELSSTVTEILSEKDMNTPGPDSVTSLKSMTKCIKILSPGNNLC
ncbi:hypothetical protein LguiA_016327 [Lonicera macranthoides]